MPLFRDYAIFTLTFISSREESGAFFWNSANLSLVVARFIFSLAYFICFLSSFDTNIIIISNFMHNKVIFLQYTKFIFVLYTGDDKVLGGCSRVLRRSGNKPIEHSASANAKRR